MNSNNCDDLDYAKTNVWFEENDEATLKTSKPVSNIMATQENVSTNSEETIHELSSPGTSNKNLYTRSSKVSFMNTSSKAFEKKPLKEALKEWENAVDDREEIRKQERNINHLYTTIKDYTKPSMQRGNSLKNNSVKCIGILPSKIPRKTVPDSPPSIQKYYEDTIQDISLVWLDTINLIKSVNEHILTYKEKERKTVDREQLTLETEMMQLAVDFAVNYSKLKTDTLLKKIKNHLQIKSVKSSEFEHFINSKTASEVYDDEDLLAIAQTIKEFNASVNLAENVKP